MIAERVYCFRTGWHWLAQGDGPIRPIVSEGETRELAVLGFTQAFAIQYEQDAKASAMSFHMEKKGYDYEVMARDANSYKGIL